MRNDHWTRQIGLESVEMSEKESLKFVIKKRGMQTSNQPFCLAIGDLWSSSSSGSSIILQVSKLMCEAP